MIDTIALVFKQHMFTILEHSKFSPSTKGLYQSDYYQLGGRANMVCKQNPTKRELKSGIYKPRLSVTKRFVEGRRYEITLKAEFSIPKLLHGNNFDEIEESSFDEVIQILNTVLRGMGVYVYEHYLIEAPVSIIHYSKNIPLTDYSTPYTYLERIRKCNINLNLDTNQTDFRNEGHVLKFRVNSFEITFYDKLKDLEKAKISDKRSVEKDNFGQLSLLDQNKSVGKATPFELLRFELRINRRQKIKQILKDLGLEIEPTFKNLFKKNLAQRMLLYYFEKIEQSYPKILSLELNSPKNLLINVIASNPEIKFNKALQLSFFRILLEEIGVREFREITKRFGKQSWYKLKKDLEEINYPKEDKALTPIKEALTSFETFRLIDFEHEFVK